MGVCTWPEKKRKKTKTGCRAQTFIQPSNGLSRENGPPLCTQMPNWENKTAQRPGMYIPSQKKNAETCFRKINSQKKRTKKKYGCRTQTFIQSGNGLSRENGRPLRTLMPNWENRRALARTIKRTPTLRKLYQKH